MPILFIYLIKANITLVLFYLAYHFGLRRLTFYRLNRFFLLVGITCAAIFPLVNINDLFRNHVQVAGSVMYYAPDWGSLQHYMQQQEPFTAWSLAQYVFWIGVAIMTIRLCAQLLSLFRIHIRTERGVVNKERVRLMRDKINPFSFFKNIYINPSLHTADELKEIIAHEKIHVNGWHTADIMAGEINNIFYWFNPGAWLMKTAIRENLEFITDREILRSGIDAKAYQYSLVKVSSIPFAVPVANNFNFSHLKQRIRMMNKKRSSGFHLLRYLLLLPVIALLVPVVTSSRGQSPRFTNTESEWKQADAARKDTTPVNTGTPAGSSQNGLTITADTVILTNKQGVKFTATSLAPRTVTGYKKVKSQVKVTFMPHKVIKKDTGITPNTLADLFIQNGPLYIINDQVSDSNGLKTVNPSDIASIYVLKGASAVAVYGEKGRNGLIRIYTKKYEKAHPELLREEKREYEKQNKVKDTGITFSARKAVTYTTGNTTITSFDDSAASLVRDPVPYLNKALIIINNKVMKDRAVPSRISPGAIDHIEVVKKNIPMLVKEYGPEAKNGIIKIYTKDFVKTHPKQVPKDAVSSYNTNRKNADQLTNLVTTSLPLNPDNPAVRTLR